MNEWGKKHSIRKQSGVAMVEFAIVLPLLIILVFGFVEIGRVLYQENMLTKAVATGARFVARVPGAVTPECDENEPYWSAAVAQASTLVSYKGGGTGELRLPGLDLADAVGFSTRSENGGLVTACIIVVDAEADFAAIFGDSIVPLLNLGPINLNAAAEERFVGE